MAYLNYLKRTLAPLNFYKLDGGVLESELYAISVELDLLYAAIEEQLREAIALSARSYGLDYYKAILPYMPINDDEESLASAISALLRIRNGCFTIEMLQATLCGCGLDVLVAEGEEDNVCYISFPKNKGIPLNIEELKWRIEEILPCHLDSEYIYDFASWGELQDGFSTWGELLDGNEIWNDLESYDEES